MLVRDLTAMYLANVLDQGSWRRYEQTYPPLFRHYFKYWAKRSYRDTDLSPAQLEANATRIRERLILLVHKFNRAGLAIADLDVVLFVGKGCSNGHAFKDSGHWIVWLPVETYGNNTLTDVFVTHEIVHALHYRSSTRYYFETTAQHRQLGRQLVTEGLATYLTKRILRCSPETALWGGYLPDRKVKTWMCECRARVKELHNYARRHLLSTQHSELFQANEPSDILRYRGGYFLGAVLIESIAKKDDLSICEILGMSRTRLDREIQLLLATD